MLWKNNLGTEGDTIREQAIKDINNYLSNSAGMSRIVLSVDAGIENFCRRSFEEAYPDQLSQIEETITSRLGEAFLKKLRHPPGLKKAARVMHLIAAWQILSKTGTIQHT